MPDIDNEPIFKSDAGDVPLPSFISQPNGYNPTENLKSQDIGLAISGEMVKAILIPEEVELFYPNYILDFTNAKTLRMHQVKALDTLIHPEGDVAIYAKLPNGLERLGMGLSSILDVILLTGMQSIFGNQCTVYKDVERGKPSRPLSHRNIMELRLNL